MHTRLLTAICTATMLASQVTPARAQSALQPMMVVLRLNDGKDPWQYGPRMASATAMRLIGVSRATNTIVFTVPNETDKGQGTVAQRNQKTIMEGFPGVVMSYNYGVNYPAPRDLENNPPPPVIEARPYVDNRDNRGRGGDNRRGAAGRFNERDRAALRDWYFYRRDSWAQVREGVVLDARQREMSSPAPADLVRQLSPLYRGGQYLIIGDNLVLVDGRDYVLDVIRFGDIRDDRRR